MRPTLGEGEDSVGIACKVPASVKAAIETAAAGAGMSASTWLRRAIDVALESEIGEREAKIEAERTSLSEQLKASEADRIRTAARVLEEIDKLRARMTRWHRAPVRR